MNAHVIAWYWVQARRSQDRLYRAGPTRTLGARQQRAAIIVENLVAEMRLERM